MIAELFDKYLGWHKPIMEIRGFDGASIHSTCKYCGKKIMRDSQGRWS